jgi:hypothetical protein
MLLKIWIRNIEMAIASTYIVCESKQHHQWHAVGLRACSAV